MTAANSKSSIKVAAKSNPPDHPVISFPIVAIGASAGGLEAMSELLINLGADTGMAFIYVQHLSPDHKSILTSLLAKVTSMKVKEVINMEPIKPNYVYIIPPDKEMNISDGHIILKKRSKSVAANLPIDILFASLAKAYKENVIGVILSGNASDGTRGINAIRFEGGLTFAQDDSAKFSSMPKSAISSGAVDFILRPKEIAFEINRIGKHPFLKQKTKFNKDDIIQNDSPDLVSILRQLHAFTGVDFSDYKMTTIKRRIIRRMILHKIKSLKDYAKVLQDKPDEINILYQDLLIHVTEFFRDVSAHQYLKSNLLVKLLKKKKKNETLRIWVPACSTGEESYSIAMTLLEIQNDKPGRIPVQIFATDLSTHAINKARIGIYTKQELNSVSPKRLQRFFTNVDGKYRISKNVRELCVFAPHNVLSDPPFSKVDFISCCNLFIYFDLAAQKKALSTFHYSLNDGGFLMLGKSETIGPSTQFSLLSKKFKIYQRKNYEVKYSPSPKFDFPEKRKTKVVFADLAPVQSPLLIQKPVTDNSLSSAVDLMLVADYMPSSVVVNTDMEILQFRGSTELFLTNPPGKATLNIIKMVRKELAFDLRKAILNTIESREKFSSREIEIRIKGAVRYVKFDIAPLKINWKNPLLLIVFSELATVSITADQRKGRNSSRDYQKIKMLEQELATTQEEAILLAQEQEAYSEELQSANEEVVSNNEELQTMNEELETSKEEIESANEELITTNQELQTRNDLLNESYDYNEAIIGTIHEPMLILDKDLAIKSANKSFYAYFDTKKEETEGVLLFELGNKQWNIPQLRKSLEEVIKKNTSLYNFEIEHDFPKIGHKVFLLNVNKIVQASHGEQLILLAIVDITELKKATLRIQALENRELEMRYNSEKKQKEELEKAVAKRTVLLQQSNHSLKESVKQLRDMNKELESFTFVSSHDMQEPLRKIRMFANSLLDEDPKKISRHGKNYLLKMSENAQRMQTLMQDLVLFAKIKSDGQVMEEMSIEQLVRSSINEFKENAEAKKVKIRITGKCKVSVIRLQFMQLFHHLLSNSFKFSHPDRKLEIEVKIENILRHPANDSGDQTEKRFCHISFTDNGIGFEQQYEKKMFDIFQRLNSYEKYKGTGIGLAICKKIVRIHGGHIRATGKENVGACFDIYIPLWNAG